MMASIRNSPRLARVVAMVDPEPHAKLCEREPAAGVS